MRTITQVFGAGETHRWQVPASYFRLLEITYPAVADIRILKRGAEQTSASAMDAGYSYKSPELFDAVEIYCASACTVKFAVSDGAGTYDRYVGTVAISGGVTVARGATLANSATATVGAAAVQVAAPTVGTKALYFRAPESNTADIYIGSSGVTAANAAIKLAPGGIYIDETASEAAFYAISPAAGQSLNVMRAS